MNIVVTGATSFLGTSIVRRLLFLEHQVYAIVRPGSSNRGALQAVEQEYSSQRLHILELDLSKLDQIHKVIPHPCDIFLHLGWDGAGSHNRTDKNLQQKNIPDTLKALEGAKHLHCRRFLFSGSQAEYGVCQSLMSEEQCCHPVSQYGKSKLEASGLAFLQCSRWRAEGITQMEYIHVRIFSIYGAGDHPWSLVNTCLDTFLKGDHMELGACTQQWNFLYIDDLVDGVLSLVFCEQLPEGNGIYNIAGEEEATMPLRRYVETMYELCGQRGDYAYDKLPPNAEGPANLIPDIRKLKAVTGWQPKVSFEEGIRHMLTEKQQNNEHP